MIEIRRKVPASFDVLLVVALDVVESAGIDVRSDIRNFISQGLNVGMVTLGQSSAPNRYRNSPLVKTFFEMGVPLLGHKDACQTQLAIVYSPELFVERGVRGKFAAQRIWMMIENGQFGAISVDDITSKAAGYCGVGPTFMAVTATERTVIAESGEDTGLWNFHAADAGPGTQAAPQSDARLVSSGRRVSDRVGIPTPLTLSPGLVAELKTASSEIAQEAGYVLCARMSVPSPLQTVRETPDIVLGFPFVPKDRDYFLKSLCMYVVPASMLHSGTWREDVYACLRLGIPVGLPRVLEPYFGAAASYFDSRLPELVLMAGANAAKAANRSPEYGQNIFAERTYSEGGSLLRAFGVDVREPNAGLDEQGAPGGSLELPREESKGGVRRRPRVCFVTSNGAGMGHLTRLLAVARRIDDGVDASFVSMSQACGVVAQYGYEFEYVSSKGDLVVDGMEWNRYFNKRFVEALERLSPDVVVFDGTWPYQGISKAMDTYDAKFVWMRRGMWRSETANTSLVRHTGFDAVIEPGDIAASYDRGPTSQACDAYQVDPIIVLDPKEVFPRERAREALGLAPGENAMLITLGAGNINKIDDDVEEVILAVKALPEEWRIFMTSPLIAENAGVTEGVENLSIYPLARFAKAFDFVVSATGYNSFHEWIAYSVPALWIANASTVTDDQIGRARYAHDAGLGLASGPGGSVSIPEAINLLGQEQVRTRMRQAMEQVAFSNGAVQAAQHISALVRDGGNP